MGYYEHKFITCPFEGFMETLSAAGFMRDKFLTKHKTKDI
jgi:hypothetical protein